MTSASPLPHRILVVDDDAALCEEIVGYLCDHGYEAAAATTAAEMDGLLASRHFDLLLLDVLLPGENGLQICRRLTVEGGPPVIMISGLADETDRVLGLEFGADDYLAKPFSPRELLARARAVLRRRGGACDHGIRARTYRFEGLVADTVRHRLQAPDGTPIPLTAGEFALLSAFLQSPQRVLSRDQLSDSPEELASDVPHRAVDVQVSRLRRKLQDFVGLDIIKTYRGVGYLFDARVEHP